MFKPAVMKPKATEGKGKGKSKATGGVVPVVGKRTRSKKRTQKKKDEEEEEQVEQPGSPGPREEDAAEVMEDSLSVANDAVDDPGAAGGEEDDGEVTLNRTPRRNRSSTPRSSSKKAKIPRRPKEK